MRNFIYHNPVKIIFGTDTLDKVKELIPQEENVMMVYGGGSIKQNGVYDKIKLALCDHNIVEFGGIEPNPDYSTCMKAVGLAQASKVTFFLSVGGGSVLDATKLISAAMKTQAEPWDILEKGVLVTDALPIGCVLTLPATGSEVNGNSVISRREKGLKLAFSSPNVMPVFSILDPSVTISLPQQQTANGIVDAFVHVMEQYLTYDVSTPLQDRQAEAILATLVEAAPKIQKKPNDIDTRATIMWCASNALSGLIGCGTVSDWTTHIIGHELTALFGLDHAQTLAIVLPALMSHHRKQKGQKIIQFGKRVFQIEEKTEDQAIDATIAKTKEFFEQTNCPTQLSAYKIKAEDCMTIPKILGQRIGVFGERGDIGEKEVEAILRLGA